MTHNQNPGFVKHKETRSGSLFLTGSGPSLLKAPLELLEKVDVMCMNHTIFFLMKQNPRYWIFVDGLQEFWRFMPAALHNGQTALVSRIVSNKPANLSHEGLVYFNTCDLPGHCDYCTLDSALGIAIYLGYERVYLVGCDGGGGHIVHPSTKDPKSYRWTDATIKRHGELIEIVSAGAFHGMEYLKHLSLEDAVAEALGEEQ